MSRALPAFAVASALAAAAGLATVGAFDRALLTALRGADPASPIGPAWMRVALADVTALGGHTVIALLTLGAVGFLALRRQPRVAALLLAAVGSGMAASQLIKSVVARPRPDLVPHLATAYDASFPSGHAMLAATAYLTLGALLARAEADRATRRYLVAVALVLVVLIGVSRVYLGVHWPTDVLAGWALGAAWSWAAALLAIRLQRARQVEPPR